MSLTKIRTADTVSTSTQLVVVILTHLPMITYEFHLSQYITFIHLIQARMQTGLFVA